jgi:hypothetical protein
MTADYPRMDTFEELIKKGACYPPNCKECVKIDGCYHCDEFKPIVDDGERRGTMMFPTYSTGPDEAGVVFAIALLFFLLMLFIPILVGGIHT